MVNYWDCSKTATLRIKENDNFVVAGNLFDHITATCLSAQ